jgi:hypothetical protein
MHQPPTIATHRDQGPLVLLAVALLSVWTLFAGKDVGWDLFNHHLYLPFSLLSGRYETDLFAAGPQSYQNPLGYVPFYWLAMSGLPAWAVGLVLTIVVGAGVAWSTHHIVVQVMGANPDSRDWRWLAFVMAMSAPVLLLVIGTSSTDPLCTALLMYTVAVALDRGAGSGAALMGGLAMGLAVAIKPTMAIFAVPAGGLMAAQALARHWPAARMLGAWAASLLAFAVAGGLWAGWLWVTFDNPVYPLFNAFFQSPLAPSGPVVALRFLPVNGWDWLTRPLELALFKPFTATEAFVPDLRPAAAIGAAGAAAARVTWCRGWRNWASGRTWSRPDVLLALFLVVTYGLWLASSGNARYAIPWFLLVGVLLVRAVHSLTRQRWALLALGALLGVQMISYVGLGDHRLLLTQAWDSRPYVTTEVPQSLRDRPVLHLSLGVQSYAGIAPFLHPAGAFINVTGQLSLPTAGPLGARLQQRLTAWQGRTRFLFSPAVRPDSPKLARAIEAENWAQTHRLGLKIDATDCLVIQLLPPPAGAAPVPAGQRSDTLHLLSCAAVPERRADPVLDQRLAEADRVFSLLEARCPRIYGPRPMVSDYGPQITWRRYMNSDAKVEISQGEGVVLSHFRSRNPVFLGSAEHVISNGGQDACTAWKQLSQQ